MGVPPAPSPGLAGPLLRSAIRVAPHPIRRHYGFFCWRLIANRRREFTVDATDDTMGGQHKTGQNGKDKKKAKDTKDDKQFDGPLSRTWPSSRRSSH